MTLSEHLFRDATGSIELGTLWEIMSTGELKRQNNRLRFLLTLANRLTSNLAPREMVSAVSAQIREVIQCDAVAISLRESEGFFTVYSLELPPGKNSVNEELVTYSTENDPGKQVFDSLKPVILTAADAYNFGKASKMVIAEGMKTLCFMPLANRRSHARSSVDCAQRRRFLHARGCGVPWPAHVSAGDLPRK